MDFPATHLESPPRFSSHALGPSLRGVSSLPPLSSQCLEGSKAAESDGQAPGESRRGNEETPTRYYAVDEDITGIQWKNESE